MVDDRNARGLDDHFRITNDRLMRQRYADEQIVYTIALSFTECFIAHYAEVAAFKTTSLLHDALLIIAESNGAILIETRMCVVTIRLNGCDGIADCGRTQIAPRKLFGGWGRHQRGTREYRIEATIYFTMSDATMKINEIYLFLFTAFNCNY